MTSETSWKKDERLQRILKQNAERRAEERYKNNKGFEQTLMVIFGIGFVLYMLAVLAIGIAWPLILIAGAIILGIALSFVV